MSMATPYLQTAATNLAHCGIIHPVATLHAFCSRALYAPDLHMPLSWTDIRERATSFSKRWKDTERENAESQSFWSEFLSVFGVDRKRVAEFEKKVKLKHGKKLANGRIDLFWPGKLLVEMKSAGKDLDRAFDQATDYFEGLADRDLPRFVLVSDFKRFRLWDLDKNIEQPEFTLAQLRDRIKLFGFVAGYEVQEIKPQDPVNLRAAETMGKLHDELEAGGYKGHALEVLLVRLLFCLFADDTGIFQPADSLREWLDNHTKEDGTDLGRALVEFFDVLNTPESRRQQGQKEAFAAFPYINGKLFEETLRPAAFNRKMRDLLLDACALDWSTISPAIFGALFQSIMTVQDRRNLGAHYTSEENILKLIKPLFLDELWAEFAKVKRNEKRLLEFHKRLRQLTFFDPACGCGNFLVITYRELRLLELEILRVAYGSGQQMLDIHGFINVDVDQFYGIEIEEFPSQIAQVALWLTDHQMNRLVSDEFGKYYARIPLKATPHIVHGNALQLDWEQVLPASLCSYVLGNPPFVGAKFMDGGQRSDAQAVFEGIESGGLLDFVAAWYVKATRYAKSATEPSPSGRGQGEGVNTDKSSPRCAFVSTNSITQGEQVGVLWGWLLAQGVHIHFAHRTFKWNNEAKGKAAVHCVIIGCGLHDQPGKIIYEYEDIAGEPHAVPANNINPYLVDAPDVVLPRRSRPICDVPEIGIGNKPIDDGNYLFTTQEKRAFLKLEPGAAKWFRRWLGADEFLNGYERWCLWLGECPPDELRAMPEAMKRVQAVRKFRLASRSPGTQRLASTPTRFHVENMPRRPFLILPEVSSERRAFIPFGFCPPQTLCSNLVKLAPKARLIHFGVLSSTMHNAWVRSVCGRMKSDYRYSSGIVYNNFPWPSAPTEAQKVSIEAAAQAVLDARAKFSDSSLADLYDPISMPPELVKAHQKLDAAVDAAYVHDGGKKTWKNDAERVAFLFTRYQALTSLLPAAIAPKRSRSTKAKSS
jgi:hypothetical protein